MPTIPLDDNEFFGNTSRPGTAITIDYSCQRCGRDDIVDGDSFTIGHDIVAEPAQVEEQDVRRDETGQITGVTKRQFKVPRRTAARVRGATSGLDRRPTENRALSVSLSEVRDEA
jgi:hypothetical protein